MAEARTEPPVAKTWHQFVVDQQNPVLVEKIWGRVSAILTSQEQIVYIAVQSKLLLNLAPDAVVLTTRRFIIYRPTLLGGATFDDYVWRDLCDAKLHEGIFRATLSFRTVRGTDLRLDHLPKAQARRLYACAQEAEEKMRVVRHQMVLEEKRAAAGGVVVHAPPMPPSPPPITQGVPASNDNPAARLKALKELLDNQLISPSEYEAKRSDILAKM